MKILIPVDGSPLSLEAVRHALGLIGQGLRADLVLANVQAPASLYEIVVAHDPDVIKDVSAGAGAHLLEPAEALCRAAGVAYECEVVSGDPVSVLCDLAEEYGCSAIVIGAHGKGAIASALLGSVSHALVHASPVPVTIVRHAEYDQPESEAGSEAPTQSVAEDQSDARR
ncbi:MAG TPA: universal stress protein [Ramlibacter sp.]|jgi:nucleotide-binding universal stress UspA family protein